MKHSRPQHASPHEELYTAVIWRKPCNGSLLECFYACATDYEYCFVNIVDIYKSLPHLH